MKSKSKAVIAIICATVAIGMLAGCKNDKMAGQDAPTPTPGASAGPSTEPPQGITVNKIEFKEVEPGDLTEGQIRQINDFALVGGYYHWVDSNGVYRVFISAGEKPTGGHGIKVISVEDNEGMTNIIVEETSPGEDDIVTQAITYPYVVVEMKGITDRFSITGLDGREFELIDENDIELHIVECIYEGQIDNNSIEVVADGSYLVFRNPGMTNLVSTLKTGDLIRVVYTISDEDQLMLASILPATGGILEILSVEGEFQGLIDNNSIEVKTGETFMVFKYTGAAGLVEGLKKDDTVKISYTISPEDQLMLITIERVE
ncbi:MAG: protease complex subunit PrcB family protein [Clostridia bacterium]|nr:protease complex subunit PrcB family protein [Clostridia bacterium]